jgi:head-tail adaptor
MALAGGKTEIITFERETRSADGLGGGTTTWESIGQAWAEVKWKGGSEGDRQGAVREVVRYGFTIYTAAAEQLALTVNDRIVWGGAAYNIRERPRRLARLTDTEIIAETGVTQ